MAIKKVELLTVDANQDTLYPKTESDIVVHGNSTVKIVLDGKVDKTQATTTPTPNTIVERTGTANINIGNGVFFNDVVGTDGYLGGIGIGDINTSGVNYRKQPVHTKSDNTKVQIWTSETAPIDRDSNNETVVKRDTAGNIHIKTAISFDSTPGNQDGILFLSPQNLRDGFVWEDTINGARHYKIHSEKNLPVEEGRFTPTVLADGVDLPTVANNTFGRYYRIGKVCYVSGRVSFTNPQGLTGHLKIGGFPLQPKKEYETLTFGLFHGLNYPAQAKEIKGHLNAIFPGINLFFINHDGGNNHWFSYPANQISQQGASIAFSGFFSCEDY